MISYRATTMRCSAAPLHDVSSFDCSRHQVGKDIRGTGEAWNTESSELAGEAMIETGRTFVVKRQQRDQLNAGSYQRCRAFQQLVFFSTFKKIRNQNGVAQKVLNSTHGSGWFGSGPFYRQILNGTLIPPTGSGWILQILSDKGLEQSTNCRWWDSRPLCRIRVESI